MHHQKLPASKRSNAWARRGGDECIRECLRTLWSWEVAAGGHCPLEPEFLGGELYE